MKSRIMSDSMAAVCLSDAVNDSCFPRSLGSELEPPAPWNMPEITLLRVLLFLGAILCTILSYWILPTVYNWLCVWFTKYRLQYLARINLGTFIGVSVLDKIMVYGLYNTGMLDKSILQLYAYFSSHLWNCSLIGFPVMLFVRYHWKRPINIVRRYEDVGFENFKKEDSLILDRTRRKFTELELADFPPCFPNGWIPIIESRAVQAGDVRGTSALGYRFCIFRGERSEKLFVMDAYCPHLGADLTAGGKVRGNCIECPFHGWYANGADGVCTRGQLNVMKPPVPNGIQVLTWTACEANGLIFVWHHAEGEAPSWQMPRVEPVCDGTWLYRGRTEHVTRCHIQEIPENGADLNHLEQLHSVSVFQGLDWMRSNSWLGVVRHQWEPEWRRDANHPHIARITLNQKSTAFGRNVPFTSLSIDIQQIGPATVHLHIQSPQGRGLLTQHIIPEGPLTMRVIHQLYTEPAFKPLWGDLLLRAECTMFDRDIALTLSKEYCKEPLPQDSPLHEFRRWYRQTFFSENSPTLQTLQDRTLNF